jgi:hypothetical protein
MNAGPLPTVLKGLPPLKAPAALPDFLPLFVDPLRILLYGDTGDGKTTLVGEFAEHLYLKNKQRLRLVTADRGGLRTIEPYVRLGIIEVEKLGDHDVFVFLEKSVRGFVWRGNKWIDGRSKEIGAYAFEGMTSFADEMASAMRESQNTNSPIGPKAYHFTIGEGENRIGVGTTDKAHYGIVQGRMMDNIWESQKLPGHLIWTASMRRADDQDVKAPVLGPNVMGKALTPEMPRSFQYCFRVNAVPSANAHPKHVLYLDDHIDPTAGMAKGLGNARNPLAGAAEAPVPHMIEPASLVRALSLLAARQGAADNDIRKRLGL